MEANLTPKRASQMNPAKCDELDYIHFMIAAQRVFTCTEAARCQPQNAQASSHDAFTRLLTRQPPDTEALWQETTGLVNLKGGLLVLDDTTLDKPYARNIQLVTRHWSGKHHRVVLGINLISLCGLMERPSAPLTFGFMTSPLAVRTRTSISGTCLMAPKGAAPIPSGPD
jgi:hypothetical protein